MLATAALTIVLGVCIALADAQQPVGKSTVAVIQLTVEEVLKGANHPACLFTIAGVGWLGFAPLTVPGMGGGGLTP